MDLLFISSFYLFRETRFGGSKRLYYFAREWSRRARLTLINMDTCAEWTGDDVRRHPEFADFLMVPDRKGTGWRERYLSATEDVRHILAAEAVRIREFLAGRRFDAVLLAYPWALSFLDGHLDDIGAPVAYLEDDLSFERFLAEARTARGPVSKAIKLIRFRQSLAFYRPRLDRIGKFVGISHQELDAMERRFPRPRRYLATYGIPLEEFPLLPPPANGPTLGFVGNFGHPPNMDALHWLLHGLARAILELRPETRFAVGGKGIPEWARLMIRDRPEISFHENVPDLGAFYAGLTAFLNPIRTGRGMRTKLVEAAAFGRPIVSTSLGTEGLEDLEMRIADGTAGLAAACAEQAADPDPFAAARRNRVKVENGYSLAKVASGLLDFLGEP